MLKPLLISSLAMMFAAALSVAAAAPQVAPPAKPTAEGLARAKTLYSIDCSMCHGDNGNGKTDLATTMSLTLNDWTDPGPLAPKDDQALFDIIRNGKDKMPPEEIARAKDADVWALIFYIRGFSKAGSKPVTAAK